MTKVKEFNSREELKKEMDGILHADLFELTDGLIEFLVNEHGWDHDQLIDARKLGLKFNPKRESLMPDLFFTISDEIPN